jgi:hypothetical protein
MANDHYVAQTYLKHFADERGLLHAYRKSDGKYFPTRPVDICHEPDGDIIPDFLSDPAYLGAFRGAFEPMWNHVVAALKSHACTKDVKFHIAGYWANLLVCTPADSARSRPPFRNDLAHRSDLMSPTIPR